MNKALLFGIISLTIASCGSNEESKTATSTTSTNTTPVKVEETTTTSTTPEVSYKNNSELDGKARTFFAALPKVAENPDNELTEEKVILGKTLYFDKILSKDNTQSCNTCHNLDTYGVDNKPFSEGNNGGFGGRNSPSTLNAALHMVQFWDGREPDVEAQAGGPVLNPAEMEMATEEDVVERLENSDLYIDLFDEAFPTDENPISFENMKKAIGAFERKLITPSKFDKYISGDDHAITDDEKEGMSTFIDAGCITCHMGGLLGGTTYQKFGVYGNYWDYTKSAKIDNGRFDVTEKEADKYLFKVPSLRNVAKTAPYFHDGSVTDLHDAVSIMAKAQLNKDLTEDEVNSIVLFMETLTGEVPAELKN